VSAYYLIFVLPEIDVAAELYQRREEMNITARTAAAVLRKTMYLARKIHISVKGGRTFAGDARDGRIVGEDGSHFPDPFVPLPGDGVRDRRMAGVGAKGKEVVAAGGAAHRR
jgi:hypothetical protein